VNEISIIVPCLSTTDILPEFIDELSMYLMGNPSDVEILVVTNEDVNLNSLFVESVLRKYPWLKFRILQRSGINHGYGALVRFGLAYSTSRYAVLVSPYGDDDLSILTKMSNMIRKGDQVVQVTRYSSPEDIKTVELKFRIYQYIYRYLTRLFVGFKISDSTYGFKMFDKVFIQSLGLTQNGHSVSTEITLKAILAGGKVEYISSGVKPPLSSSNFRLHKEGFGYFWLLIRGLGHRIGILWF
jgi:hypothetical protein